MSKLEELVIEQNEQKRKIEEEMQRTRNDNTPIEIERRLIESKAELELLKPYIKTIRRMKTWEELQKEFRKNKSA